jgi:cell division protein FtsN
MINTRIIISCVKIISIAGIIFYYSFYSTYISNLYNEALTYIAPKEETQKVNIKKITHPIKSFDGDKYSFYEKLKFVEVKSNSENYKVEKETPYRLWCGSFREPSRAENLRNKLKELTSSETTLKGEWNVVMTEDYPNKRSAEAKKWEIKKQLKIQTCILHRVRK